MGTDNQVSITLKAVDKITGTLNKVINDVNRMNGVFRKVERVSRDVANAQSSCSSAMRSTGDASRNVNDALNRLISTENKASINARLLEADYVSAMKLIHESTENTKRALNTFFSNKNLSPNISAFKEKYKSAMGDVTKAIKNADRALDELLNPEKSTWSIYALRKRYISAMKDVDQAIKNVNHTMRDLHLTAGSSFDSTKIQIEYSNAMKEIATAIRTSDVMMQKFARSEDRASQSASNLQMKAVKAMNKTTTATNNANLAMTDLLSTIGALGIAYGTLQAAQATAKASDELVSAKARLSIITDDPEALKNQVYQMSQEVRSDFMDMAGTVSKMGINVGVGENEWFSNTDQLVRFNELLAKTFKTGGQNNKEIGAAMLQLTQAMSSGRLQGDEFRSMFENSPLYIKYIGEYMAKLDKHTDAYGNTIAYTAGELKQLAAESKITTDIMINAMMDNASEIEKQFSHLPATIGDRWTQVVNMIKQQASVFFIKLNSMVNNQAFNKFFDQLSDQLTTILSIFTTIFSALSPIINVALSTWKYWTPIAAALIGLLGYTALKLELAAHGFTKVAVASKLAEIKVESFKTVTKSLHTVQNLLAQSTDALKATMLALGKTYTRHGEIVNTEVTAAYLRQAFALRTNILTNKIYNGLLQHETLMIGANTTAKILNAMASKSHVASTIIGIMMEKLHITALTGETVAYGAATVAATAFNFAVSYLLLPLIAIVGAVWLVIKAVNMFTGSSYSLIGVLSGSLMVVLAGVYNYFAMIYNGIVDATNALIAFFTAGKDANHFKRAELKNYNEAWEAGNAWGDNISSMNYTAPGNEMVNSIKQDTGQIADSTSATKEDMDFLRAVAEDRVASRISNINVNIVNNNDMKVNGDRDLDGVVDYLTSQLEESINGNAMGAHL